MVKSIADFIVEELGWFQGEGGICLRYYPNEEHQIHNSNIIGASLLARVNALRPDPRYSELARSTVDFTIRHQTAEAVLVIGVEAKYRWVDSFHTGYVLEALDSFIRLSGDSTHAAALEKGYRYFVATFFEADQTRDTTTPRGGHWTSNALRRASRRSSTYGGFIQGAWRWQARLRDLGGSPTCRIQAGYFYYRKYPLITNKTPTLHWGQATISQPSRYSISNCGRNPGFLPPFLLRTMRRRCSRRACEPIPLVRRLAAVDGMRAGDDLAVGGVPREREMGVGDGATGDRNSPPPRGAEN